MEKPDNPGMTAVRRPFFSVIIPMYNVGDFIGKCLGSVYAQDIGEEEYEVVIVDDSSSDDTLEIAESLTETHCNTLLLKHDENQKQGSARNSAMRMARGEYIVFLDSDDCWQYTNVLTTFRRIIRESHADVVDNGSEYNYIDCNQDIALSRYDGTAEYRHTDTYELINGDDFFFGPVQAFYSRQLILDHDVWFADNVQYEDIDWRMRIVYHARNIVRTDIPFYCYRINPASTLNSNNARLQHDRVSCYRRLTHFASQDLHPRMKDYLSAWILNDVTSFPFFSRKYDIGNSLKAVRELRNIRLLDKGTYRYFSPDITISKTSLITIFLLKHFPLAAIAPYRILMVIKDAVLGR